MKARVMEPAGPWPAATQPGKTSGPAAAGPKLAGPIGPGAQDARERFGQLRRAAFAVRGFAGEGRQIPDRAGGESYALVSGGGPCPVVLLHGGVGATIEWAEMAARLDRPVVIPDRPGFGLSDPHDYRRVDFRADAANWLLDLTDTDSACSRST
jgi:pimeloyl-ACP methyl ester carboxylesterase